MFFHRNIHDKVVKALSFMPVVLLTGPRQSGKTTLIKEIGKSRNYSYINLDDLGILSNALNDPMGFIQGINKPAILDEVQRVPDIFLAIKYFVDKDRIPGLFALTGSINIWTLPTLGDSLACRMAILNLYPLSQGEILSRKEVFIDVLFNNRKLETDYITKSQLNEKILKGGYPLVQSLDYEQRKLWFESYITAIIQKDIQNLSSISALIEIPKILNLIASRVGSLLNVADISRASQIPNTSLHRYFALLEALFLVFLLPAWSNSLTKRLVKSPKAYLIDTGLLSHLLNLNSERALNDSMLMGRILENFVVTELLKQSTWSNTIVKLYHFRTNTGIEIDIILENSAGNIVAIEIKWSNTVSPNDFKGLAYLQDLEKKRFLKGIILYLGEQIIPYSEKCFAIPIASLWSNY